MLRHAPAAFTVELTRRCTLSCRHCYLPETQGVAADAGRELDTREWKTFFGELSDLGGLFLVLTGGDVFLRPDALELARHARALNFDTKIFTNGLLVSEANADEMAGLGLSSVDVSLYGLEAAHDFVTGRPGSFQKTLGAMRLLAGKGVPVKAKCPLMTVNFQERHALLALTRGLGLSCSFDPTLAPRNDGGRQPYRYRLESRQTLELLSDPAFATADVFESVSQTFVDGSFPCSAGNNMGAVDPYGDVTPCLQYPLPAGNLRLEPFKTIWEESPVFKKLRSVPLPQHETCRSCRVKDFCSRCPGIAWLEGGDAHAPLPAACEMAAHQMRIVELKKRPLEVAP